MSSASFCRDNASRSLNQDRLFSIQACNASMTPDTRPLITALAALRSGLDSLHAALAVSQGVAFDLPKIRGTPDSNASLQACIEPREDNGAALWDVAIPVRKVQGKQGANLCRSALLKITRRRDQPPTRPDRRPGLIWIPGQAGVSARRAARTVNDLKSAFQSAVEGLGLNHMQRAQLFKGTPLQHVLLIQAYRKIQVIGVDYEMDPKDPTRVVRERPFDIQAVSFSWSGASRKVLRATREEVLEDIANRKIFEGRTRWESRVRELPDAEFAYVRRLSPFPVANLKIDGRWAKRVMAAVPLIYTGPSFPTLKDLRDYQPKNEPGSRNQGAVQVEAEPLIAELGIHRYVR